MSIFGLKYAKLKCMKISGTKYSRMDQACFRGPYPFTFFKGCLPQNLLGPFLNTFPHTWMENTWKTSFFESLDKNFGPQQI